MPGPSVITVRRTFSASAEQVFDAWLDPELLPRWMFHPSLGDQRVDSVSIDARHGGAFYFEVSRSTGTEIYYGTYIEFDRPHALAFTWIDNAIGIETTVRLSFRAIGDRCEVTLRHDLGAVSDSIAERAARTWDSELRCLSNMLN